MPDGFLIEKLAPALGGLFGGLSLAMFWTPEKLQEKGKVASVFIAGGISAWFGVQALVNIGGVVGALPMTGLTLPFLSYGGSSLIASMAAAGLLLNVARDIKTSR